METITEGGSLEESQESREEEGEGPRERMDSESKVRIQTINASHIRSKVFQKGALGAVFFSECFIDVEIN